MANVPDYCKCLTHSSISVTFADTCNTDSVLEVAPTATQEQIRTAYKKAALKWHPDRVPSDSDERPKRTKKFQAINDAYYTLSSVERRKEYDEVRQYDSSTTPGSWDDDDDVEDEVPRQNAGTKKPGGFWSFFGGGGGEEQPAAGYDTQWGNAFSEMMDEADLTEKDGEATVPNKRFWSVVGAVAGASIGYIVGNVVGATAGAAAGHKLGGIRDKKGKSVYAVFQELDQGSRARLLSELATKIFQGAIS